MRESLEEQLRNKLGVAKKTSAKEKSESYPSMKEDNIVKGSVVYLSLSEYEGLTLKDGYSARNKFVTIVGVLPDGTVIGSLLINTKANVGNEKVDQCQYPLRKEKYVWLDYSSWLDCTRIVPIARGKVLSGKYCGALDAEDLELVIQCIKDTDLISNKIKKKYGVIQ